MRVCVARSRMHHFTMSALATANYNIPLIGHSFMEWLGYNQEPSDHVNKYSGQIVPNSVRARLFICCDVRWPIKIQWLATNIWAVRISTVASVTSPGWYGRATFVVVKNKATDGVARSSAGANAPPTPPQRCGVGCNAGGRLITPTYRPVELVFVLKCKFSEASAVCTQLLFSFPNWR